MDRAILEGGPADGAEFRTEAAGLQVPVANSAPIPAPEHIRSRWHERWADRLVTEVFDPATGGWTVRVPYRAGNYRRTDRLDAGGRRVYEFVAGG